MKDPATICFSNVVIKQQVEAWAEGLEFDPQEQILMLLEIGDAPLFRPIMGENANVSGVSLRK